METTKLNSGASSTYVTMTSEEAQDEENARRAKKCRRKHEKLLVFRLITAKLSLAVSLASIVVMIINTQLILSGIYPTCSEISLGLKVVLSVLTALLIVLIWVYNYLQLEIFRCLRHIDSLFMTFQVNPQRSILVILETLITLPHPLPMCFRPGQSPPVSPFMNEHEGVDINATTIVYTNTTGAHDLGTAVTPSTFHLHTALISQADSILATWMFVRLYHIARFTVLHSRLFRTMLSYSLGALAQTKYNFLFIFKSYLAIYKGYFLATLALAFTFIAAWCIYICDKDITKYEDALWVVGITFFTVGKYQVH